MAEAYLHFDCGPGNVESPTRATPNHTVARDPGRDFTVSVQPDTNAEGPKPPRKRAGFRPTVRSVPVLLGMAFMATYMVWLSLRMTAHQPGGPGRGLLGAVLVGCAVSITALVAGMRPRR